MPKIRVLVVDDAVVIRRLVSDSLTQDPDIEIAGIAPSGEIALARIPQVNPDVITLDIEMPGWDGLETLRRLRKLYPRLPVIMFSTLTERGASATLDALALGANDYVTKPANVGSVTAGMQRVRDELVPRIKALCRRPPGESLPAAPAAKTVASHAFLRDPRATGSLVFGQAPQARPEVLAIGVSTGGPNALSALISKLPAGLKIPILIVQHMPPLFTRLLAERLGALSSYAGREGANGSTVRPGELWVAPGGFHMKVQRYGDDVRLVTNEDPPENSCRPAVDVLFRSVAEAYGGKALALVLTGMGQDGLRGCGDIREAGGRVIAQDEASSVVWGMPGAVVRAGLADEILPLEQIPAAIVRRVNPAVAFAPRGPANVLCKT